MGLIEFEYEKDEDGGYRCLECEQYIGKGRRAILEHQGQVHHRNE